MEPLILIHAVAAAYTLLFGAFNLLRRRRGDKLHRIVGAIWVLCIYLVCLSSFGIRTLNGGFSWLHGLSLFTIATVTLGMVAIYKRNVKSHKAFMTGTYFGVLGAFIGVIVVPERRIPQLAMNDLPLLLLWVAALGASAAATIIGIKRSSRPTAA